MGCINSTSKLHAYKNEDTFRVSIIRLQPPISFMPRHGMLELTPEELIFTATGKEQIVWALQHLRRYGLNGNIFSFEAGRRSANGPGIYTFRCYKADILYQKFQRYVNAASNIRERNRSSIIGQITFLRSNVNLHSRRFLEPTIIQRLDSCHSLQDGSDSLNNLPSLTLETDLTQAFQHSLPATDFSPISNVSSYSNINPRAINKNIYIDQPLRINFENDNILVNNGNENSNFLLNSSTLEEILKGKNSPLETISANKPISSYAFSDNQRLYVNIDNGENVMKPRQKKFEHYYENLGRTDFKQLLKSCSSLLHMSTKATSTNDTRVNYVVLDLDNVRSQKQSTKPTVCSDLSLGLDNTNSIYKNSKNRSVFNTIKIVNSSRRCNEYNHINKETSQGYTTIDFIKTCALIKSSINYPELDTDQDRKELRLTRHSKPIQKTFLINE